MALARRYLSKGNYDGALRMFIGSLIPGDWFQSTKTKRKIVGSLRIIFDQNENDKSPLALLRDLEEIYEQVDCARADPGNYKNSSMTALTKNGVAVLDRLKIEEEALISSLAQRWQVS